MKPAWLESIAEAIAGHEVVIGDSLIRLKMTIGFHMAEALRAGECKTIQGAMSACGDFVAKRFGRSYGSAWWRTCYLYQSKLSDSQRALILEKHVSAHVVDRAVNSKPEVLEEILDAGMCDRKRRRRASPRRPMMDHAVNATADLVMSRPFDEDRVRNALASILADIRGGRSPLTVSDFDRLVLEAKQQAGVKQ